MMMKLLFLFSKFKELVESQVKILRRHLDRDGRLEEFETTFYDFRKWGAGDRAGLSRDLLQSSLYLESSNN